MSSILCGACETERGKDKFGGFTHSPIRIRMPKKIDNNNSNKSKEKRNVNDLDIGENKIWKLYGVAVPDFRHKNFDSDRLARKLMACPITRLSTHCVHVPFSS